jgi:ubiquinone/menaquinone biosynthesis C-methylase UbiE
MPRTPDITDYDKFDYDYRKYWKSRKYENLSEKLALDKLLKKQKGSWFLDLGGSFGRNYKIYRDKYQYKIIADYSIKSLKQAQSAIHDENLYLVAVNAYNLPFKNNSFNGVSMIRVIHHLENPAQVLDEVSRVTQKLGIFILEYANKIHIKAQIRALIRLDFKFFNKEPYIQKSSGNPEGTTKETPGLIINFHPKWIKSLLVSREFSILSKVGVSFLRIPAIKKVFPIQLMISLEKILQRFLGKTNIPPSIFLKLNKKSGSQANNLKIKDLLCCPACKADLIFSNHTITCSHCKKIYKLDNGIYDLRYPTV